MECGIRFVKWLLFVFNFIFTLCGLAILIVGILIHLRVKNIAEILESNVTFPSIALIIIGAIIFTVAFFGCCGAVRESHCMMVTFAMLLLTILVIQVAVAIFAFVKLQKMGEEVIKEPYTKTFEKYYTDPNDREIIDFTQSNLECCGITNSLDWNLKFNNTIPWSCCQKEDANDKSPCTANIYQDGCVAKSIEFFKWAGLLIGGVAIGIAAVEFIGIIFALCLANSIRNAERRGYRV